MNSHIQIVAQLSKFNEWNKENQQMEQMYNAREEMMNILSYVDFSKLCNVMKVFTELNQNILKEGITFSFLSSSRDVEWKKN